IRPSLNYLLDLNRWGHYTFNLGGAFTKRSIIDRQYFLSLANVADTRLWNGPLTTLKVREYWSDPIMPTDEIGTLPFYNNQFGTVGGVANRVTSSSTTQVTPKF